MLRYKSRFRCGRATAFKDFSILMQIQQNDLRVFITAQFKHDAILNEELSHKEKPNILHS